MAKPDNQSRSNNNKNVLKYRYSALLARHIEQVWQETWSSLGIFNVPNPVGLLSSENNILNLKEKIFIQDMFPYPSGKGLHIGHILGYVTTDAYARFNRMNGYIVLHALGFDAFGLPAEQYAFQTGIHPRVQTKDNIVNFLRQLSRIGLGHDYKRSFSTTDTKFYKWTQWIFLQIYNSWFDISTGKARPISELINELNSGTKKLSSGKEWLKMSNDERIDLLNEYRLVYQAKSTVNWCPGLGTVLANEEVNESGCSDRGNFPVFRKHLNQWMMRITSYADRILEDLKLIDWPEKVKLLQRNWIGRSVGIEFDFLTSIGKIKVFTTNPEAVFGVTFLVITSDHHMVDQLIANSWPANTNPKWKLGAKTPAEAVNLYRYHINASLNLKLGKDIPKIGVFLGNYAINPINGQKVPIFIASYMIDNYGTSVIMSIPSKNKYDREFANKLDLPIVEIISFSEVNDKSSFVSKVINSECLNGLTNKAAKEVVSKKLQNSSSGSLKVRYKLRDWLFARQRYWGEPFPIVYDTQGRAHALPETQLPVVLPDILDHSPILFDPEDTTSEPLSPLSRATTWSNVKLDLGNGLQKYTRDTNVMPQWAGSSWYELRYTDPYNSKELCSKINESYWMGPNTKKHGSNDPGGVDLYIGGIEHSVLHLLYSRFWHKILFDLNHISSKEPYRRLLNQGYIQAFSYKDINGNYVTADKVVCLDKKFFWINSGKKIEVKQEFGKIGKSLKNAVSPDIICDEYGADTLRVYIMFMGPLEASRPWSTKDIIGIQRFLQRVWRLVINEKTGNVCIKESKILNRSALLLLHSTLYKVFQDYQALRNNTAIAKLIEFTNYLTKEKINSRKVIEPLILMMAPIAPHIAEELWKRIGNNTSLVRNPFPKASPQYLIKDITEYMIQINGKLCTKLLVNSNTSESEFKLTLLTNQKIIKSLDGDTPKRIVIVYNKLVNFVI